MADKKIEAKYDYYSPKQWFHIAVTLFLMFGFGLFPPFATLTPVGMKVLGIFLGVVYGYSTCEVIWPSLFAFIAFGTSGYTSFANAIASMMGSTTVFQVITQYFTAGAIIKYGFGKWFVRWSLTRKIFQGNPLFYTWCFMVVFMWSGLIVTSVPMSLLLYAIWGDIADTCGYDSNSSFRYYGFGGILISLVTGAGSCAYKGWQLGLANAWAEVTSTPFNLGMQVTLVGLASMIIVTLYVILGARLFKVDFSIMKAFDVEKLGEESKVLRPRAKRIVIFFVITMLLTIYAGTFTKAPGAAFINKTLTTGGLFCLCSALLMILPSGERDGKPCIVFKDIKHTDAAVSWPVILMCAVTIPVATALTNEATGILPWLSSLVTPLFEGRGPVFILVFTIVVELCLTNIGSNIAFGTAMIPIVAPFVLASDMNPALAGVALVWTSNIGLILPGASAPAAIFHGRPEIPNAAMRTKVLVFAFVLFAVVGSVVFSIAQLLIG